MTLLSEFIFRVDSEVKIIISLGKSMTIVTRNRPFLNSALTTEKVAVNPLWFNQKLIPLCEGNHAQNTPSNSAFTVAAHKFMVIIKHYEHDATNCLAYPSRDFRFKASWSVPAPDRVPPSTAGAAHTDDPMRRPGPIIIPLQMRAEPIWGERTDRKRYEHQPQTPGAISVWAEEFRPEPGPGCLIAQNAQHSHF